MDRALLYLLTAISSAALLVADVFCVVLLTVLTPLVGLLFVLPMRLRHMDQFDDDNIYTILEKKTKKFNLSSTLLAFFKPVIEEIDSYCTNQYEAGHTALNISLLSLVLPFYLFIKIGAQCLWNFPDQVGKHYEYHEENYREAWYQQRAAVLAWLGFTVLFPIAGLVLLVTSAGGYGCYRYREQLSDFYTAKFSKKKVETPTEEIELINFDDDKSQPTRDEPTVPGHFSSPLASPSTPDGIPEVEEDPALEDDTSHNLQ